ncbi:MAG: hypothetical protein LBF33_03360 [Oscillospiraceae bacterium]|nr:hypothetical protein [Oscillospiraceae bacterium]
MYFATFASSNLHLSAKRIYNEVLNYRSLFKGIFIYNEHSLETEFLNQFKNFLNYETRGFGFYCWKPQIILQSLREMKDGDVLIFTDVGCELHDNFGNSVEKYLQIIREKKYDLIARQLPEEDCAEQYWSKGDILSFFGVYENKETLSSGQLESDRIIVVKSEKTVKMFSKMVEIYKNKFEMMTDKPSVIPNKPGFKENRHDQSLFSLMIKSNPLNLNIKYSLGELNTVMLAKRNKEFSTSYEDFRIKIIKI